MRLRRVRRVRLLHSVLASVRISSVLRLACLRRLLRLVGVRRQATNCCVVEWNVHRQTPSSSIGDPRADEQSFSVSGHGVFSHFCDCCYRVVSATTADSLFSLHWQTAYRTLVPDITCHQNTSGGFVSEVKPCSIICLGFGVCILISFQMPTLNFTAFLKTHY